MKTMLFLMFAASIGFSTVGFTQDNQNPEAGKTASVVHRNGPVASFDKTVCDLGDLIQNSPGTASFTLTNKGNEPLLISSATASCGCTNLSYSQDPVLPGKSVTISVTYNAAVQGNFIKTVTVKTNTADQMTTLQIKGKVIAKS